METEGTTSARDMQKAAQLAYGDRVLIHQDTVVLWLSAASLVSLFLGCAAGAYFF